MSATRERPGYYKGRHFTEYVDEVRSLKRAGRLEEGARLLLNLIKATEAESRATGDGVAPWYYEHLAIVYRKQKDPANEKRLLLRFAEQVHAPGAKPEKLLKRLHAIGLTEGEQSRIEARQAANMETSKEVRAKSREALVDELMEGVGLLRSLDAKPEVVVSVRDSGAKTAAERERERQSPKRWAIGWAVVILWAFIIAALIWG